MCVCICVCMCRCVCVAFSQREPTSVWYNQLKTSKKHCFKIFKKFWREYFKIATKSWRNVSSCTTLTCVARRERVCNPFDPKIVLPHRCKILRLMTFILWVYWYSSFSHDDLTFDWSTGTGNPCHYSSYGAATTHVQIDCLTGDHVVRKRK